MRPRAYLRAAAGILPVPLFLWACDSSAPTTQPINELAFQASVTSPPQAATASQGPVYRFSGRSNYAGADFWSWTPEEEIWGYVYVFQDASGGSTQTGLYYSVWICDPNTWECEGEEGYGDIPRQDVRFGSNSVTLSTNTSADANPDFFRWAGDGGLVEVVWNKASFYSTHGTWNEQSTYGTIRVHYHGNSTYTSATARGSIVGNDFEAGWAQIGSAQNVQMEISVANVVASVSGSGQLTVGDELRTFSFHALQLSDGRVGGEWQRYNRAIDAKAHGKVTCMTLEGNQAWLGGHTTRSTTSTGDVGWRVVDGGQGAMAQDSLSLQLVSGSEGFAEEYCWSMGDWPMLWPIEAGQISIRQ